MSLRARLIAGMVVVVVALAAAGWITVASTRGHLVEQVDEQLRGLGGFGRFGIAVPSWAGDRPDGGVPPDFADLLDGDIRDGDIQDGDIQDGDIDAVESRDRPPSPVWIGVLSDDGTVTTLSSPTFGDDQPAPDTTEVAGLLEDVEDPDGTLLTVDSDPAGVRYRLRVLTSPNDDAVRLVALPLDDVDAAARRLAVVVAAVTTGAGLVLVFVIGAVVRLGVTPLRRMTRAATVIADGDLSHRVTHGDSHTEADQLGAALNRMMGTIEEAFDAKDATEQRLRRFVADASHELRTPTSTIRGYAELYRLGGLADRAAMDDAMQATEQEAARLGRLVEDLLLLARTDRGRPLDATPVDLSAVAADAVRNVGVAHGTHTVELDVVEGAVVTGDPDRLRQVIGNLVDNAVQHTPDGTTVRVGTTVDDGHVEVRVSDNGPGIPSHVGAQVFARFWRADESRTRASGGSGLGLSIVQSIVEAHGGDVALFPTPGGGATFLVRLRQASAVARAHHDRAPVLGHPTG
ncbi:sensor histidine kinase [Euzebya pacifica]|uniref:histidine kinase n=1 Tax=Euzebya pacifica TaxID=1608957 RepID=A0A346Y1N2_9ACTN|nr:HAMP domain-containing sensor histidine kinase [Euzebya pacifica]AXV08379.1 sensor histidine kinase [Euzebya pacifica]